MNKKAILALCIAILIPVVSYLILKQASDHSVIIPRFYLPDTVISKVEDGKLITDTQWHTVANMHFVNQLGDSVSLYDIKDKSIVIDYFFTSCGSICPALTKNMVELQQSFIKGGNTRQVIDYDVVHFLSFSVDPERDSVTRLKQYADRFGVDHDNWWLATGNRDSIYNFAFEQLKVDKFSTEPVDPNFVHTNRFVLLDKNYHVRGYYNGLDSVSISKLARDIGLLMLSKNPNESKLPFDPLTMAIFFVITFAIVILGTRWIFKQKRV